MPNRLEWESIQLRYKEACQNFLASKEEPPVDEGAKDIPVITISDDNDVAMECSAENVDDDDKNSVKKSDVVEPEEEMVAADDGGEKEAEGAAAVVVNPDSSITDKALTDTKNQKFIS